MANERMGQTDHELQQRMQIEMIGNVFYNLLNSLGQKDKDPKYIEMGQQIKHMLQTRQFDNLMGPKVPHVKQGVMNLLKVVDLPPED